MSNTTTKTTNRRISITSSREDSSRIDTMSGSITGDFIESRIGVHDSNRFEVKLDYVSSPTEKQDRYVVESYFFIPRSLGVQRQTYGASEFYSDVHAYIRFKTPTHSLRDLCKDGSLIDSISKQMAQVRQDPNNSNLQQQLIHDIKLFGCVVRARIRDHAGKLSRRLKNLRGDKALRPIFIEDLQRICGRFLNDVELVIKKFRTARQTMFSKDIAPNVTTTFQQADEYLSLVVELYLTQLVEALDSDERLRGRLQMLRRRSRDLLLGERSYRKEAKYTSVVDKDGSNESFIYRKGQLKKFIMSVLWLDITKEKEGRGLADIGASVAAGTAMFFAVVASIWQLKWFMVNTWGFVFTASIIYIMKDRMKDALKRFFTRQMTRFLADYNVHIHDPYTGKRIGSCREAFSYVHRSQIPVDVAERRYGNDHQHPSLEDMPESIIKYEKEIRLKRNIPFIKRLRQRHFDINDIMRFEISRFLLRTDDPQTRISLFNEESDSVEHVKLPKVYHVNVVFRLSSGARDKHRPSISRVRVIIDRNGIRRLEET